jgi:hypothetical protein
VGDADTLTVDKVTDQLIQVVSADATTAVATIEAKLVDATGAADSVSFELKDAATNLAAGTKLKTTDVETVNIKVSSDESISLADVSIAAADKFASLVLTGDKALTISALNADVNVINASGMATGGSVVQTGRSGTTAATYTGTAGADTFIMANLADVIAAGEGSDTLDINVTAVLGGIVVDLSATDVVVQANGSLNTTVQSGFINVDLAGYAGGYGAVVTANKAGSTITGTAATDQITGGAGADTIVATAGNDVVTGGASNDVFKFTAALLEGNSGTTATFDGEDGTADAITLTNATTGVVDADFRGITNVEVLNIANGTNTVVTGANAVAAGIRTINAGTGADTVTIASGITKYVLAGGADEIIMVGAGYTTQLTIDDSAATTDDVTLNAIGFQNAAAAWTAVVASTDVTGADKFHYAAGVLTIYNENKTGGAGTATITLVGVNGVAADANNAGKLIIDVAA